MSDKTDQEAAKAHEAQLKGKAISSAKHRDKVALSGAPQRDHAGSAVLHVVLHGYLKEAPTAAAILGHALNLLESDGYDRDATWKRMSVMARQPRRKLKPPKPKGQGA